MRPRPARHLRVAPRLAAGAATAAIAACASGPSSRTSVVDQPGVVPITTRVEGAGATAEVRTFRNPTVATEAALPATPDKAFAVLPTVYEALGVTVNVVQSDARTFGALNARMPRRLGKVSVSQYVDCGINATGSPNADVYAVTATVLSRVAPAAGGAAGSTVSTQVSATARPLTVSGGSVQCASTGRLEAAINARLADAAAR